MCLSNLLIIKDNKVIYITLLVVCCMLFNSLEFIVFLPIVFVLYWFVFKKRKWQNLFILVASYVFYGWWNCKFLLLIAFTSACSFGSGIAIEHFAGNRKVQKYLSVLNITVNLSILGVFKYYNFFVDSIENLLAGIGWKMDLITLNLILPVGISFYTFQALSYTIDVYRGRIRASYNPIEFFAFLSFFPQLVAGPIERATNLLPQFQNNRIFDYNKAVDGCRQMLWGFFKKIIIADMCASVVNAYWDLYSSLSGFTLLLLGILFSFQIYCDFSGYSDIAIGCAKLFGIDLMRNFNVPYFSRSIPEFWRRWHISLTTWFRDYIYFPLGGSRCSKLRTIRNIFIVWGISGLWHGANWTFVCWGLYHASLLTFYNVMNINTKYENYIAYRRLIPTMKETLQLITTFFPAVIGWIIFRAESLTQAYDYFYSMFSNHFLEYTMVGGKKAMMICISFLLIEWYQRDKQHALQLEGIKLFRYRYIRYIIYYVILALLYYNSSNGQTFIYFQF